MTEDNDYLIEKITSHEVDLLAIYKEVYAELNKADSKSLPISIANEFTRFDHPDIIEPAKAVAILKAMLGSTSSDKFSLENCYSVSMSGEQSLSSFVENRLHELGIGYHDFWPYLRSKGWLNETPTPFQ